MGVEPELERKLKVIRRVAVGGRLGSCFWSEHHGFHEGDRGKDCHRGSIVVGSGSLPIYWAVERVLYPVTVCFLCFATAIERPVARNGDSACRGLVQPAPKGMRDQPAHVAV